MLMMLFGIITGLVISYFFPSASLAIAIILAIVIMVALEEKYRPQVVKSKKSLPKTRRTK